jgi:hypothetical protein
MALPGTRLPHADSDRGGADRGQVGEIPPCPLIVFRVRSAWTARGRGPGALKRWEPRLSEALSYQLHLPAEECDVRERAGAYGNPAYSQAPALQPTRSDRRLSFPRDPSNSSKRSPFGASIRKVVRGLWAAGPNGPWRHGRRPPQSIGGGRTGRVTGPTGPS